MGSSAHMKTEGQDITSGYPTLREAIQRTFPTLVRLSQLTEPNRVYGLRGQTEEGVAFFLDKTEETINTCDNLLLTWRTHGTPLGDRKVKEIMYETVTKILEEIDHWRDNSSTEDTLASLTSVETLITKIHELNHAIIA